VEEGLRWWEASEADTWAVGEECAVLGRGQTRRTTRGGEKSAGGWWLPFKGAVGDSRGGGGGSGSVDATRRGARGAWIRPAALGPGWQQKRE
jgi:hypothetical protein